METLGKGFHGFPRQVRYTPVPSPLFGPLLTQIDDLGGLKCTLRFIWLLHQKRGFPRFVTLKELLADRTLVDALAADGVRRALGLAVSRGTLVTATTGGDGDAGRVYALNREEDRNALATIAEEVAAEGAAAATPPHTPPWEGAPERSNVFALYEDNIGMLNPMIADELREAEELYPLDWLEDAFREAVGQNKRSWRYIARILERWEREGRSNRDDGEPGRHLKKAGYY